MQINCKKATLSLRFSRVFEGGFEDISPLLVGETRVSSRGQDERIGRFCGGHTRQHLLCRPK